jgi:hypothetical protein
VLGALVASPWGATASFANVFYATYLVLNDRIFINRGLRPTDRSASSAEAVSTAEGQVGRHLDRVGLLRLNQFGHWNVDCCGEKSPVLDEAQLHELASKSCGAFGAALHSQARAVSDYLAIRCMKQSISDRDAR